MTHRPLAQTLELLGTLDDTAGPDTPRAKFRCYLRDNLNAVDEVREYVRQCLKGGSLQKNRALQDIVNHIGELLGFRVIHGRYHDERGPAVIDGHWISQGGHHVLIEVKGAEDYMVNPGRLRSFAGLLERSGKLPKGGKTSGLYILRKDDPCLPEIDQKLAGGDMRLRRVSLDALLDMAEGALANKLRHEDVEQLIFDWGASMDEFVHKLPGMEDESMSASAGENDKSPIFSYHAEQNAPPRRRTMEEVNALLEEVRQADVTKPVPDEENEMMLPAVPGHAQVLEDIPVFSTEVSGDAFKARPPTAKSRDNVVASASAKHKVDRIDEDFQLQMTGGRRESSGLKAVVGSASLAHDELEWDAIGVTQVAQSVGGGGVVYNASLDSSDVPGFPDLPEGPWSTEQFDSHRQDEALFNAVTRQRKKPFIKFAPEESTPSAKAPSAKAEDKGRGVLNNMIAGLGLGAKREEEPTRPSPMAQSGKNEHEEPPILVTSHDEALDPETVNEIPLTPIAEAHEPETVEAAAEEARPVLAEAVAMLEGHPAMQGLVVRLWPHAEFEDWADALFACGGAVHDLDMDAMLELAFLVEIHRLR